MGRIGISEYQVFRAADQLAADGVHPSVDTVRVELGNTGSRTTINKYLKAWRERRAHREHAGANLGGHLLQVLSEQSEIILNAIEAASVAKFQAKSQHYESTLQTQNEQLRKQEAELNNYRLHIQELQTAQDLQHSTLQKMQSELSDSRDENQSLRESLAKEIGRRETLEGAIADRDRQLDGFQKELKTLHTHNEILTDSHGGKTAELQQLHMREREYRTLLKEKSDEIKQLKQALKGAQELRNKEIGRLTLSVNQLVQSRATAGAPKRKELPQKSKKT